MKLKVNVYLHFSSSALFPIDEKYNNWNLEKVHLVLCGRLLVVCGRLWLLPVLIISEMNMFFPRLELKESSIKNT